MQRRKFIKSQYHMATIGKLPISLFSKANQNNDELLQSIDSRVNLPISMNSLKTQTTTVHCKAKEVKIHAIQTGSVAVKKSHLTNHTVNFLSPIKISLDKEFTDFMPIWVWLIEHPEGNIVIDTGENADVMNPDYFEPTGKLAAMYSKRNFQFHISKENEIGFQLNQLGIKRDTIKCVVLTHLHMDHTDGIKDFKNVEIIINEKEYKYPSGHFPELIPSWFKPKTVKYRRDLIETFNEAYPLTKSEDLLQIPTILTHPFLYN